MEKQPLISVIVPVYNVEEYLPRCLDSIINQTYTNLEILLIDDGATDNSGKICDEYAQKDNRIRVFHKENGGVSSARNLGLDIMRGEYVAFVDSDDAILTDYIQVLFDLCIETNAEIARVRFYSSLEKLQNDNNDKTVEVIEKNSFSFCKDYGVPIDTCCGALIKKEVVEGLQFETDLFIGEDSLFIAKAIKNTKKIVLKRQRMYFNFLREGSALRTDGFTEKRLSELESWKRICDLFSDAPRIQETCFAAYALRCRLMLEKYFLDDNFRKNYFRKTHSLYKKYYKYAICYFCKNFKQKISFFMLKFFPSLFLFFKNKNQKGR